MMERTIQDLRYAVRALRSSPGFTLAAVLTLALGIGANAAIFSVVDGVLLRPAPFPDIDRLVMVWETDRKSGTTREPASVPDFQDFQKQSTRLGRLAAITAADISINAPGVDPFRVAALGTTVDFLSVLGVQPLAGRTFAPEEDRPGGANVALISERLWERLFARRADAVGRTLLLNDRAFTIVGVLPATADFGMLQMLGAADYGRGFADRSGPGHVDVWVPLQADPASLPRDTHPIIVVARLAPGATAGQAQAEMTRIAADLETAFPVNDARGVFIEPVGRVVFGPVRTALFVLLGAVALVLLVACGNVANLMLARGAARAREVTVRLALGATAGRLARQFLAESVVLTALGAVLGLAFAWIGLRLLLALAPAGIPRVATVGIDARVLLVSLVLVVLVTLLFGLVPTVQAWRRDLQTAMRERAASGGRLRASLVIAELTLAVMLMAGAGLLIKSLWRLQGVDPGFAADHVLKVEYDLPASRYPHSFAQFPSWPEVRRFHELARERVAALPGVQSVSLAGNHPLEAGFTSSIAVVGREAEARDWPEPAIRLVDTGYFATLRVAVLAGRPFQATDDAQGAPVVMINAAARRRFFAAQEPLGQLIRFRGAQLAVVGVVGDERFHGLAAETPPAIYLPLAQMPGWRGSILIRTQGDPAVLAAEVHAAVRSLDPALPLFGVEPLTETVAGSLGQRRFTMLVLGVFAALALALAAIGVHGVLSYSVAQRTREIGIRMALGADRPTVRALVMRQGARLAAAGVALGLAGGLATTRVLATLLYGVSPNDPLTFGGVALALGLVAVVASWLPARRATGVDPIVALRSE
jgi:predicted permease